MALPTQGMMLSERPSGGSTAMAGGGGGGPLTGAGSIGNYKGVMLCNRPFAGTAAAAKGGDMAAAVGKHVFVAGKVKSEVGFAAKTNQTEKLLRKRVKQETALTRHRRWLADLQLTKQALEDQYMEDLKRKNENKRRFAEREARMRKMTRELALESKHVDEGGSEERGSQAGAIRLDEDINNDQATIQMNSQNHHDEPAAEEKRHDDGRGSEIVEERRSGSTELRAVEKRRKRDGKPCRPMWAMTEAKAEAETELKHEEELEELLEFTQGLDFSKYIRDAEVQSMIDQVKKRITEMEEQPEVDETMEDDDKDRPLDEADARLEARIMKLTHKNLRELAALDDEDPAIMAERRHNNQQEDDNVSVARTALSEGGRSVRSVHSRKSLAAVAEKARTGIVAAVGGGGAHTDQGRVKGLRAATAGGDDSTEAPVSDIVVVTHNDDGGLRLGGKNTVSNLPYIRRNPAV